MYAQEYLFLFFCQNYWIIITYYYRWQYYALDEYILRILQILLNILLSSTNIAWVDLILVI